MEPHLLFLMPSVLELVILLALGVGVLLVIGIVILAVRASQRQSRQRVPHTTVSSFGPRGDKDPFGDLASSDVTTEQLVEFVGSGGTVAVEVHNREVEELVAIVEASANSGGTVVIRGTEILSRDDLCRIAVGRQPRGRVVLE